jgi:hypothetical protein
MIVEFQAFPKIARLNRNITITEKIDGTNAAVVILPLVELDHIGTPDDARLFDPDADRLVAQVGDMFVFAQSRNRFVTVGDDNYGFAGWVQRNAESLVEVLGDGRHFGEWWGAGIQRKYGLTGGDKRFSLFNTGRWTTSEFESNGQYGGRVPGLGVVPLLYEGSFDQNEIGNALMNLAASGSVAAPGFNKPEGIVVYHHALRDSFKVTLEGDDAPKGVEGHALDVEAGP